MSVFPRNLFIYEARDDFKIVESDLTKLSDFTFVECEKMDRSKAGWIAPAADSLYHAQGQNFLLKHCKQERKLNVNAFKKHYNASIKQIEAEEERTLTIAEKLSIKDELLFDVIPSTLPQDEFSHVFIVDHGQFIVVETSSSSKAEEILSLLRRSLGSLPVVPFSSGNASTVITHWLETGETPAEVQLYDTAKLKFILDNSHEINIKHSEHVFDDVAHHIKKGAIAKEVGLNFQDRVAFSLTDQLNIKKIKSLHEDQTAKEENSFDADLYLVFNAINTLTQFLTRTFK